MNEITKDKAKYINSENIKKLNKFLENFKKEKDDKEKSNKGSAKSSS